MLIPFIYILTQGSTSSSVLFLTKNVYDDKTKGSYYFIHAKNYLLKARVMFTSNWDANFSYVPHCQKNMPNHDCFQTFWTGGCPLSDFVQSVALILFHHTVLQTPVEGMMKWSLVMIAGLRTH